MQTMAASSCQTRAVQRLRSPLNIPAHFKAALPRPSRQSAAVVRAGFIGSPENIIVVASTTAFLVAGRFGLAPTVRQQATSGLRLVDSRNANSVSTTGDPAGFTAVDVLGHGTMGHVVAVGAILGLRKADIENAVQGSKKAGFDLVEVNVSVPDEVDAKLTKSILDANGMGSSASMGLALKHDISSEDNGVVADGKEHLIKCLQKVNDMGGKVMAGVNYCAMHKYGGPASATSRRNCATTLKELAARAADMGIVYSIEVVNRYETNIANTGAMAMDLLDEAGNPDNLTVHLDTYHMNIEESAMDHAIGICGDKLAYVHVGESHRGYLGTGSIDWGSFWQALAKHNYKGPITFESFSSAVVSASLSNTLCVWRNLWDDSEDLATSANAFMRSGVHAAYKIPRVKSSA